MSYTKSDKYQKENHWASVVLEIIIKKRTVIVYKNKDYEETAQQIKLKKTDIIISVKELNSHFLLLLHNLSLPVFSNDHSGLCSAHQCLCSSSCCSTAECSAHHIASSQCFCLLENCSVFIEN